MKRKFFLTTLLVCFVAVCFAIIADLNGKWAGVIKTPDGNEIPVTYDFKVDGDKLTGTADSPNGQIPLDEGKINGNDFSFSVTVDNQKYPHTGKYYGDSTTVDIDFGGPKAHVLLKRPAETK
jgi:hypothetical protein